MASEIRVDKINSLSGVGTVTLSPTGVDISGITTAATLRATTGIVTSLTAGSLTSLGAVSGTTGTFTGAVSGTTGTFTGDVDIADTIVHTGDTNTKIRFPAADTITAETGGSERARVDSSGRLLVGTDTSRAAGGNTHKLFQIESTDASSGISLTRNSATSTPSIISFCKSRGTSNGSSTIVQDDDELGRIKFSGADGSDILSEGARIQSFVDGTPGSDDMPGRLTFSTTADGAVSPTERLRIASTGKLTISNHGTNDLRSLSVLAPKSQIQFGTANDVGGFLMSSNNGQFGLSGGAYFSGSGWVATHTGSTQIRTDGDGDISFCSNTSLTSGNAFTPSEKVTFNSDGDVTIADGDLVIGTAGHGIDFSAQTASSDGGVTVGSEVLDHYEEGTWTPVLRHYHSGSFQAPSGSAGTVNGYYTRIGNVCYINATFSAFSYTNLTNSSYAQISELPFAASSSTNHISVIHTTGTAFTSGSGSDVVFITSGSNTYLNSKTNNSNWDWAVIDGGSKYLYISGFYFV